MNSFKVWFGESLDANNLETAFEESKKADLILVIGTSSQVYPVAMIAPDAADLGIPVIEINLDTTPKTDSFMYHFHGKSGEILPLIVNQMKSDHWFDHFKNSIFQSIQSFFHFRMGNESVDSGLSAACAIAVLFVTPVCLVILNILQTFSLGAIVSPTIWAKG